MKIIRRARFKKAYKYLSKKQQLQVNKALRLFMQNPKDPSLKNHSLKGAMIGKRSIVAGFDLRIIFKEEDGYLIVILLSVGSHNQVYK